MLSIRCRLFLFALKNRHLFRLSPKRESGEDWLADLETVRRNAAKSSRFFGKLPKQLLSRRVEIGKLPAEWIEPGKPVHGGVILYFRGGGYVLGTIEGHRGIVAKFVQRTGMRALLFEYRNAPEYPYPSALNDAVRAYKYLLEQEEIPASQIVFAGDSAGGGLLLATLLKCKEQGMSLPACAAALSPWTDVACTGESLATNAHRCLAPPDSWLACKQHYAGKQDATHPFVSPLYGDLAGLPPLFLCAGEHETLLSDALRFTDKATKAGVDVTLEVGERLCHCYPACAPLFPEATHALDRICVFLARKGRESSA